MVYNSCMVKYIKIYRAYGVNKQVHLGEHFYLHMVHFRDFISVHKAPVSTLLRDSRTNENDIIHFIYLSYAGKHTGHMVCSCLNVGPWWSKANPILIYQGVHCCTNVCYLHLDISPLKSVTIV